MEQNFIVVKGAREHNLKNIDIRIPRNKLVVVTGLSGSGKSSLAFDTIYAEGQRRYVESLSAYARQFLGMLEKPDVDYIEGLSPAIAIEQRTASKNPRSTVATATEIYDYLRLLFARIGVPHCPTCGKLISAQTTDQIVDSILALNRPAKLEILAPLVRSRKGEYKDLLGKAKRRGFIRVRVDKKLYEIDEVPELEKYKKHSIELVVDRLVLKPEIRKRLADSIELALKESTGLCVVAIDGKEDRLFSEALACVDCGFSFEEITPRFFSFNSPFGACPTCLGLGTKMEIDPDRIIADPGLSVLAGAVKPWGEPAGWLLSNLEALAKAYDFSLTEPWARLPFKIKKILLNGTTEEILVKHKRWDGSKLQIYEQFEGVVPNLMRLYKETDSDARREYIERFMSILPCPACNGTRLKPETLSVKINDLNIAQVVKKSVKQALSFFSGEIKLTEKESLIAHEIIKELKERLGFLKSVGLEYLTLERSSESLAGGEEQRVRLATQIGSGLVGVVYILDEPSIGLHQRDNRRLLDTLSRLRDLGNTVLVVEHDKETILSADFVIDLGPGAGEKGGYLVATGTPKEIEQNPASLTGAYLDGRKKIALPENRRLPSGGNYLTIKKASANNLKNIDVKIPLGLFVCITGVSGSGKSTLLYDILYRALAREFYYSKVNPGEHEKIENIKMIDKVINIDQSPIGRTPRSNPATYTQAFMPIRDLFSQVKESKIRGYGPGRFSFNVRGGRCEACAGDGIIKIEMHFLPDVYVPCEVCKGKRYNRETLDIKYKTKNIYDVLNMTVTEALSFFENIPMIKRKLELLHQVGLGYIKLGQPAPTLSGGEAQRVKLAKELSKIATGRTIYILDEPTTGLHFEDVKLLLSVLDRLVSMNNTVVVIEHNLEVIKCADWIIDLGPEGGDEGGLIVAEGPPETVAQTAGSYTGQFLKKVL